MIPLCNVNWGPTDALTRDAKFSQKWIETPSIKKCLLDKSWLISGEKGSGKSAIRRALSEIYANNFTTVSIVDFDDITFKALYENLFELASATKLSKTTTLSHYWQYTMIVDLIIACAKAKPAIYMELLEELPSATKSISFSERLVKLLEDSWNKIDEFTGQKRRKKHSHQANLIASSGLSAKFLSDLSKFPLEKSFIELRKKFFSKLEEENDNIILILDGFDRLRNDGAPADAIRLIFDSLVDAVQSVYAYQDLPPSFEIKAFVPHDRYLSLSLRDFDKVDSMHVAIRWNKQTLQDFLKKRLELTPRLLGDTFRVLWRQVMPETILNNQYKIEEDSFDYILRHTMMRPRQLQIHLDHLASSFQDQNIDPSSIPKSISESSKKTSSHFINEFKTDHPNLDKFISSLYRKNNIIEYKEFRKIVADALYRFQDIEDSIALERKIDILYAMGFFGVLHFVQPGEVIGDIYCPPTKESTRHYVDFFFKNAHPSISSTLQDESIIAFHPMFVDYANLIPHSSLIVG